MKTGKWICLTIIGLMLSITGNAFSENDFTELLTERIISYYNLENSDVEIEVRSNRFDLDSLVYDDMSIKPMTNSDPRGLLSFEATLLNDQKEVGQGQVRVKISYFGNVLVATERLGRHKILGADNSKIERMDITSLTSNPLTSDDSLAEFWTKRDIRKGQIISSNSVEKIPTILSGQGVSILYRSSALEISLSGIAVESGYTGEKIKIKNDQSNKILTCTVLDNETVEVVSN